jgi:hypothetical protein
VVDVNEWWKTESKDQAVEYMADFGWVLDAMLIKGDIQRRIKMAPF